MILNLGLVKGYVGREKCGLMPIRGHSGVRHGMIGKTRRRKRKLVGMSTVAKPDQDRVLRMLGKR